MRGALGKGVDTFRAIRLDSIIHTSRSDASNERFHQLVLPLQRIHRVKADWGRIASVDWVWRRSRHAGKSPTGL
jgi:hypothetical protein